MRISRIYLPLDAPEPESEMRIDGDKAHYLRNVLRIKPGQSLHFFTPSGIQYTATIGLVNKREITLNDIQASTSQPKPSRLNVTLIQAISASDRMDYSIQKAAELGCRRLLPVSTEFCSHKLPQHKQAKKHRHWQGVAISACEQSGRADLLEIEPVQTFQDCLEQQDIAMYLDPLAEQTIHDLPKSMQTDPVIWIGPEGGFSPDELAAFEAKGLLGIQLGQRVLRTETVAPVILSALHCLYGDFKHHHNT